VIKRHVLASTLAIACASGVLAAQSSPTPEAQQPSAPGATTPTAPEVRAPQQITPTAPEVRSPQSGMTLSGCLYHEDQIPGRTPNVAERAGVLEDYILAGASTVDSQGRPGATPGATGTAGSNQPLIGNMYKVDGPADERLKALVGKRVEVMGRIDPQGAGAARAPGAPTPDRGLGPDEINLPEFEATSIREISGTCPATPEPRSR